MEVHRVSLPFRNHHDLLGVGLAVLGRVAIADGEEEEPKVLVAALPEIRDVPAQHVVDYFGRVRLSGGPAVGRPVRPRRQGEAHGLYPSFAVPDYRVDLATFHPPSMDPVALAGK